MRTREDDAGFIGDFPEPKRQQTDNEKNTTPTSIPEKKLSSYLKEERGMSKTGSSHCTA
jgi:hypothetical protein